MTTSTRRYGDPRQPVESRARAGSAAPGVLDRLRAREANLLLACVVAAVALPTAMRSQAGPDLWWHVHTGQRILDDARIPAVDDLSYTAPGEAWANHEWLTQVVFAWVHGAMGGTGLVLLRAVLFVATVALLTLVVERRVQNPALTLAVVAPAVVFAEPYLNVRAHTFTYLLLMVLIFVLDRVRADSASGLVALPVMMALWANLHGGFVLGLGLVSLTLGHIALRERADRRRLYVLGATGAAALVATFLNPAGLGLFAYLVSELGAEHSLISEWQPAAGATLLGVLVVAGAVLVVSVLARRPPALPLTVMMVGSVLATLRHARFFVVVALVGAVAVAEVLPLAVARLQRPRRGISVRRSYAPAALVMMAGAAGLIFTVQAPERLAGLEVLDGSAPVGAAEFLEAEQLGPNLASHLEWGGFFIATLSDDYKVAVDGRNLTVYDDEWVDGYLRAMQAGTLLGVSGLEMTDVWVLRPDSAQVEALDASSAWTRAYGDAEAVVFVDPARWPRPPVTGPMSPPATVWFPDIG